ncbi:MAG: FAD-dependent oxidoreductase [Eubacteriales bacterium]|nr:FAD-dependent oxidoreductase [Eubacteriales bacterium]
MNYRAGKCDEKVTISKSFTAKGKYDVIVAGGGVAGIAAAVTVARKGKSVLLVEKSNILGGLATLGLVNFWVPLCNGRGVQIIKGIAEEMLRMSIKYGYDTLPDEWKDGEAKAPTTNRYITRYSPEIFAIQLTEWIKNEGVDFFFDCIASEPVMDGKHCCGLILESKSGREYYAAEKIIDATGDCDVLRRAGVPVIPGKNYFTYYGKKVTLKSAQTTAEKSDMRYLCDNIFAGDISLYGKGQPENIPLWSGLTVEEVTDYLTVQQTLLLERIKDTPRCERDITLLPHMPQFRTTCRIDGDACLKESDKFRHFDDSVAAISDFDRRDYLYEVPYGTLVRSGFDNLITCGRSANGEGYGWDIIRVIPVACLTGQAAGEACVLSIESGSDIAGVDIKELQSRLEKGGVMIHFPDSLIPKDTNGIGEIYYSDHV